MSEKYIPPKFRLDAFNCPFCNAYAHQEWYGGAAYQIDTISRRNYHRVSDIYFSCCAKCKEYAIWKLQELKFPRTSIAPVPTEDMPENVKEDYQEARELVSISPRAAAALLQLALQKLLDHLGGEGKDIFAKIADLVEKGLPEQIQQSLDIVRVIGNNAVHPGQIDIKEDQQIALYLFDILNIIVEDRITKPKKIKKFYDKLPESSKKAIKNRDKLNKP